MAIAPLKTSFLAASMIGFLVSALYIPKFSITWAFAFGIIFTIMFIASMISMVRGTPDEQLYPRPKPLH
ncbi:MAG: hypothetical protein NTW67_04625 [Candidatus Woesearchaeota archaeon]|nr:hypothetical protein [Candidatus Woesearchaeota archaeon]